MKRHSFFYTLLACGLLMGAWACNDHYNKHYDESEKSLPTKTLMQLIEAQPELQTFAELLRLVAYDKVLNGNQTYTVWAPVDDAWQNVDKTDTAAVLNIVTNHIARTTFGASGTPDANVFMLNTKLLQFHKVGAEYRLDASPLLLAQSNQPATNGLLHLIAEQVPYRRNLWEYIDAADYDSIRNYLYSFTEESFDEANSTKLSINTNGLYVYDSVKYINNKFWETGTNYLGKLNNEDSLYTMILPNNAAWTEAYERIKPYYYTKHPQGDSLQRVNTQFAVVQDLVFYGQWKNPTSLAATDSIVSTHGSVFYDPAYLFGGVQPIAVSNGLVYPVTQLSYRANESWNPEIIIEAEQNGSNANNSFTRTEVRSDRANSAISEGMYLEVYSTSASLTATASLADVTFELPNLLAASYDIYVVTLPITMTYPTRTQITKLVAGIQQYDRTKGTWGLIKSGGGLGSLLSANISYTSATDISELHLVKNFTIPESAVGEDKLYRLEIKVAFTTSDNPKPTTTLHENRMYIDKIIIRPH